MNLFREVCLFISLLLYSVLTLSLAISHMETRLFKGWGQIPRYGPEQKSVVQSPYLTCLEEFGQWGEVLLSHKLRKSNDHVSETTLLINSLFLFDAIRRTNYVD